MRGVWGRSDARTAQRLRARAAASVPTCPASLRRARAPEIRLPTSSNMAAAAAITRAAPRRRRRSIRGAWNAGTTRSYVSVGEPPGFDPAKRNGGRGMNLGGAHAARRHGGPARAVQEPLAEPVLEVQPGRGGRGGVGAGQ